MDRHRIENGSIVEVALEPKSLADRARLLVALEALAADDPQVRYSFDPASGQTILGGQSEDHLESVVRTFKRTHGFEISIGGLQVSYRERLTRAVTISHTYSKVIGAAGEFARVVILFEPTRANSGFAFEVSISNGDLLETHISGVRQGLEAARHNGVLAGFPVIDFKATLTHGAYHEVDSTSRTFEIAARQAFVDLRKERAIELVEPIFSIEVATPREFVGAVVGDLRARRSQAVTTEKLGDASVIRAQVPVATMFGYRNDLSALTRGKGTVSSRLDHYEAVPRGTDDDPRFPPAAAMRA